MMERTLHLDRLKKGSHLRVEDTRAGIQSCVSKAVAPHDVTELLLAALTPIRCKRFR